METSSDEEFKVQFILAHEKFEKLLRKALKSEAKFSPSSIDDQKEIHSKYAYLVHWQGSPIEERTWETEEVLGGSPLLTAYKTEHGLPLTHEKFEKKYGRRVWRKLSVSHVSGIRYLLTKREKEAEKNKRREDKQRRSRRPVE